MDNNERKAWIEEEIGNIMSDNKDLIDSIDISWIKSSHKI